jgi:hypothetical protein
MHLPRVKWIATNCTVNPRRVRAAPILRHATPICPRCFRCVSASYAGVANARIDATSEPIRPTDLPIVHQLVVLDNMSEF